MKAYCRGCQAERQVPFRPEPADLQCPECGALLVSTLNRERKPLKRKAKPKPPRPISEASPAQRAKIDRFPFCIACGVEESDWVVIDPAHLTDRAHGGCDHEDCVLGLCRNPFTGVGCHRRYDEHELDLLVILTARLPAELRELQHMLEHLTPVEMVERLAGERTQWSDHALGVGA